MHTAADWNRASLDSGEDPATNLISIVADMTSLIIHVQASARFIEAAIERDFGAVDAGGAADVVVLDDVTPCYSVASEALSACGARLDAALQSLLGTLSAARRPHSGRISAHTNPCEPCENGKPAVRRPSPRHGWTRRPCAS
jgi:hypothetical protein